MISNFIVLLGAGEEGQTVADYLCMKGEKNLIFADNNPNLQGTYINGIKVYSVEDLKCICISRVIICHNAFFSAIRQLYALGIYRFEVGVFDGSNLTGFKVTDLTGKDIEVQKNKIVIFSALNNSGSNAKQLYNETPKNINENFDIVFIIQSNLSSKQFLSEQIIYEFLTGKLFIAETNMQAFLMWQKLDSQIYLELGHGMPLKSVINHLESQIYEKGIKQNYNMDHCISYSSLYTYQMSLAFGLNPYRFKITGIPRNDLLFGNKKSDILKRLQIPISESNKIIYYMPTFRGEFSQSLANVSFQQQKNDYLLNLGLEYFDIQNFSQFLLDNNITLLIKIHPMEEEYFAKDIEALNLGSIHLITNTKLDLADVDNYILLGIADVLITDYSSVYIDYLLLDKPIIFTTADKGEYARGFMFDPPEPWMPGEKPTDQQQLETAVKNALFGEDVFKAERTHLKNIFHKYQDGHSSLRVWEWVDKILSDETYGGIS
jgi:CDP-glycerol glycerophosphotransferase (TagB/SpsB family)